MFNKDLKSLMENQAQAGKIQWIGLRPSKRGELQSVPAAKVDAEQGILGDHYQGRSGKRQVTLIQAEHITGVAAFLGMEKIEPSLLRRNIVVSGMNLLALKNQRFKIGQVLLEGTGLCHPCSRMEENLGHGGYNAMRGHGGITARVIEGGEIHIDDPVLQVG